MSIDLSGHVLHPPIYPTQAFLIRLVAYVLAFPRGPQTSATACTTSAPTRVPGPACATGPPAAARRHGWPPPLCAREGDSSCGAASTRQVHKQLGGCALVRCAVCDFCLMAGWHTCTAYAIVVPYVFFVHPGSEFQSPVNGSITLAFPIQGQGRS
jgi:hypothetical protein